jgi:hypothetical protein
MSINKPPFSEVFMLVPVSFAARLLYMNKLSLSPSQETDQRVEKVFGGWSELASSSGGSVATNDQPQETTEQAKCPRAKHHVGSAMIA